MLKQIYRKLLPLLRKHLSPVLLTAVVCIAVVGIVMPQSAVLAGWLDGKVADAVLYGISWLIYWILVFVMGNLAVVGGQLLVYAASFTGFTNTPIIIESWTVVRDLSNMFFIVILLLIAFGTLLRLEAYSWKKLLPKMVLAAILINYSRAICGVLVDASQVVMLTFTAAIAPAASQSLVTAFQLGDLLSAKSQSDTLGNTDVGGLQNTNRLLSVVAVGFMLTILVTVEFVYIAVLVGRLAFIWFLTVLSPLAFACSVLPATEKYYKQWWEMFGRYVTVGPMILFFLWLALFISAKTSGKLATTAAPAFEGVDTTGSQAATKALDSDTIIGFIISTMMLMAGLKMAQDNSSELGSITSKASEVGKWITKAPYKYGAKPLASMVNDRMYAGIGLDLNIPRQWELLQHKRKEIQNRRVMEGRIKAGQNAQAGNPLAMLGAADMWYEQYMPLLGVQGALFGRKAQIPRFLFGQFARKSANKNLEKKEKEQEDLASQEAVKRSEINSTFTDQETMTNARRRAQKIEDKIGTGHLDTRAGSDDRAMLEGLRDDPTAGLSEAQVDAINELLAGPAGDGKGIAAAPVDFSLMGAVDAALQVKADAELEGVTMVDPSNPTGPRIDKSTADRTGRAITNKTDLENLVMTAAATGINEIGTGAAFRKKKEDKAKEVEAAKKDAEHWAPIMDFEGLAKQQSLMAEANKEFHNEKNEDKLRAYVKEKFEEGDGSYMLGGILQAAKVGHLNEICKEFKVDQSVDGLKKLTEMIINQCGTNREQAMAAMNDITTAARDDNGHWVFGESVGYKNGRHEWRSDGERYERVEVEASKRGASDLMRRTRLASFEYKYDPGNAEADAAGYVPHLFYPIAKVMAKAMSNAVDMTHKGLASQEQGKLLYDTETPNGKKNNALWVRLQGEQTPPDRKALAHKADSNWRSTSMKPPGNTLQEARDHGASV